jgi:hypothetical protein
VTYLLRHPEGQALTVVSGCRHALGPGRLAELHREMVEHKRSCPAARAAAATNDL